MTCSQNWDVLKVLCGSHAYGVERKDSSRQEKGVYIPERRYYTSPFTKLNPLESKDSNAVMYEIRTFCKRASECNPNILEVLFTDKKNILHIDSVGEELLEHRDIFLSQKAENTFKAYAKFKLKKLQEYKRWDNPPEHPGAFKLPISQQQIKEIDNFFNIPHDEFPQHVDKERVKAYFGDAKSFSWFHGKTYKLKMAYYKKYKSWKDEKKVNLIGEVKYDTEHAFDCIRLLRMGVEILETGKVLVLRPDWKELSSIRNGEWNYSHIIEESENLLTRMDTLSGSDPKILPQEPNYEKIEKLCIKLIERKWSLV